MSVVGAGSSTPSLVAAGEQGPRLVIAGRPRARQVVSAGMRGADGAGSSAYQHTQASPSDNWIINHNLGYRPAVSIYTPGGMLMLANVQHISENQARAYFDNPTAGYAVCS